MRLRFFKSIAVAVTRLENCILAASFALLACALSAGPVAGARLPTMFKDPVCQIRYENSHENLQRAQARAARDEDEADWANEMMHDARRNWQREGCDSKPKSEQKNCGLATDDFRRSATGTSGNKFFWERRKRFLEKFVPESKAALEKAQQDHQRTTRQIEAECELIVLPPAPQQGGPGPGGKPGAGSPPAGQGGPGTGGQPGAGTPPSGQGGPGTGGSPGPGSPGGAPPAGGQTPPAGQSTPPGQAQAECDPEKIEAAFAAASQIYFGADFPGARAKLDEIQSLYGHCPGVAERISAARDKIEGKEVVWGEMEPVMWSCDIEKLKAIITRLRFKAMSLGRPKPAREILYVWIDRLTARLRTCEALDQTQQTSSGGRGGTGPGGHGSGSGGRDDPTVCPQTRRHYYAPGAVRIPSTPDPICGGQCPHIPGWHMPAGARCGAESPGSVGATDRPQAPARPAGTLPPRPPVPGGPTNHCPNMSIAAPTCS